MQSREYWRQRTLQVDEALNNRGTEYYHELEKAYTQASKKTQQEVIVLYNKLAKNNNISLTEAKKLLTTNELKEFRWSVNEYIKYGKENAISGEWMKELENASLRYRISRLEAMKIQMQHHAECVFAKQADGMTNMLSSIYTDGYYRTAHMIQTGLGVGHNFAKIDTNRVEKVLSNPWAPDGKNFSERIWGNHRPALVNDLHKGLTQNIIRGEAPDKLINDISKSYDVAKNKAGNLVMTESAYFGNLSQQDCYAELDVEEQQFCATLDTHTSPTCQQMDGKVFKSKDLEVGVNMPPLHCRCRSVMVPYFDDEDEEDVGTRIARGEDGKTYEVPANMTYPEWQAKYLKGEKDIVKPPKPLKSEPVTLKDKIQNIKSDMSEKQATVTNHKVNLKSKQAEIKIHNDDLADLSNERMKLQLKKADYERFKDRDFDFEISEQTQVRDAHAKKVAKLEAEHDRFYSRPERGTPEYAEWSKWRKSVDYESMFNDLVDEKSKVARAESEIKLLNDQKALKNSINIDDVNKRLGTLDTTIDGKYKAINKLEKEASKITDDIADVELAIESDIKKAGQTFINELDVDKLKDTHYRELRKKRNEAVIKYNNFKGDVETRKKLYDEYLEADKAWHKAMEDFTPNADVVRSKLSEVRELGASDPDELLKVHLKNTKSAIKDSVIKAYDYYPRDWVDKSVKHSNLTLKKVDRGHYNDIKLELYISGDTFNRQLRTAFHELGHRFEHVIDGITDVERVFYNRRTKGETLQWLGKGYKSYEKSRFDDFLDKYMGKEYPDKFYELVSMGFEIGFTDPLELLKDKDMAELIYGILTTR